MEHGLANQGHLYATILFVVARKQQSNASVPYSDPSKQKVIKMWLN